MPRLARLDAPGVLHHVIICGIERRKIFNDNELKSKGYNLDTIEQKVCDIFGIEPDQIYSKSRQRIRAEARRLYCYWAVGDLGYSLADLARLFGMTAQGIGYAVTRGERISKEQHYRLID